MTAAVTAEFIRQRLADLPEEMPALRLLVLFGRPPEAGRDRRATSIWRCMYVSTLDGMIRAMGGKLDILATFPERKCQD